MKEIPKEVASITGAVREKVRRAIARVLESEETRGSKKVISVAKVRAAGQCDNHAATKLLSLWRAGALSIADSWEDPPPDGASSPEAVVFAERLREAQVTLERMIREAAANPTDGARERISMEVMAQLAGGLIDPDIAGEIKGQLDAALKAGEAKRKAEPPPEDPTRLRLASELALKAATAVDLVLGSRAAPIRAHSRSFVPCKHCRPRELPSLPCGPSWAAGRCAVVVKLNLAPRVMERLARVAPLAARAAVVRRLVEVGLEAVEQDPARLVRPAVQSNERTKR